MELFLHTQDQAIALVEVDEGVVVEAFIADRGDAAELEVWLGDADEPLARERTFLDLGVTRHSHLHLGRRRQIATTVRYNTVEIEREFGPNKTFERVYDWAAGKHGFDLTADEKAKHTLVLAGTDVEPEMSEHIERYAVHGKLRLDLVPQDRHAG